MKRSGLPGGLSRSFAAISAALVVVDASAASAPEGLIEPKTGVALEVLPLQANYYAEPRIQVEFTYRVTKPQDDGKAVVTLLDVDSGEAFTKQFRIPLSFGGHRHWAAWGGDKGPWTSSTDSELDLLLAGELAADKPVPDGFYIPQVSILAADGAVLAEQKHSSDQIRRMRASGQASHKVSPETIRAKAAEIRGWFAELKALEAKARAAGADTSLPGIMITALDETLRVIPEHVAARNYNVVDANHGFAAKQVPRTRALFERLIADPASAEPADGFPRPKERMTFKNGYFHDGDKPVFMMGMCMFALWPHFERMREMNYNLVHIGANPLCLFPDSDDVAGDAARAAAEARSAAGRLEESARAAVGLESDAERIEGLLLDEAPSPSTVAAADPAAATTTNAPANAAITVNPAAALTLRIEDVVLPEPTGKLLMADYDDPDLTIRRVLDRCSELGIKVDLGLNMHPVPKWFFEKYPDARLQGYSTAGFIPFDIEHPAALAFTEKFFDIAMKEVAGHPALNSIWLANEPCMLNVGPLSGARFREAMREKYETLGKLNAAWGTTFKDFEEIKPDWSWTSQSSPKDVDFWWFNVGRLTNYFEFMRRCVRKYDKTVNTCFKISNLQMGWHCPPGNVDAEGVNDISEIIGMDSGTMPFAHPYYDWLRSLSPEKPLVNLEFKGGGDATWLTMWRAALWGMAGIDWWCWHGDWKFASAMCYTVALHDGPLAMAQVQRNLDVVMAFQQFPRSPFVFVYPDPVLPRARSYFEVHTPTYHAISQLGHAVDYATEKRIAEGRLDQMKYDIIVLPAADYIRDETFERVGQFVSRGGKALVVGVFPERGPMGAPRDLGWLQVPKDAAPGVPGCTNSVRFAVGKGEVWTLPAGDEATLRGWIGEFAAATLPPRPVVVDPAFESRTIRWKDGYVTYILPNYYQKWDGEGDARVDVVFGSPVEEAVDLISGERLDPANIVIPRFGVRLIRWTPAAVGK